MDEKAILELEKVGRSAIFKAGSLIRDHLGAPSTIQMKGVSDYVTNVDQECEALIMDMIGQRFPDHHVISEEMGNQAQHRGITWIIDPLDGTTNFIHGFPNVAVSIAVHADQDAILGLVLDPMRRELFVARRGKGAYLNGNSIKVRDVTSLEDCIVATGFPFRAKHLIGSYMATFERVFHRVSDVRRTGSAALDLAYLAAGRVDGFWEIGLQAWDVAAGALLIQEAGGRVSDFWGKQKFVQNGHIVAGAERIYDFLLEQVRTLLAPVLESNPLDP
jgi:myo-inositol-1(or 4)-monophosphatase